MDIDLGITTALGYILFHDPLCTALYSIDSNFCDLSKIQ